MNATTEYAVDIAERVLEVLARYKVHENPDTGVEILMSPNDIKALSGGSGGGSGLWGQQVTEAYWVKDGHPEIEITVPT